MKIVMDVLLMMLVVFCLVVVGMAAIPAILVGFDVALTIARPIWPPSETFWFIAGVQSILSIVVGAISFLITGLFIWICSVIGVFVALFVPLTADLEKLLPVLNIIKIDNVDHITYLIEGIRYIAGGSIYVGFFLGVSFAIEQSKLERQSSATPQ